MAFFINFILGAVVGSLVTRYVIIRNRAKASDVMTISGDRHVMSVSSNGDGTFHISVAEKSVLSDKNILDMNVSRDALYDVIGTARNKGYIDSDAEALMLAKYEA